MFTQAIPAPGTLLAQMPSGRDLHSIKPFQPPFLDSTVLDAMRAPPDRSDDVGNDLSSEDEGTLVGSHPVGAFPGTAGDYRTATPNYY